MVISTSEEEQLVELIGNFLGSVADLTPGKALERRLNQDFGPGHKFYDGIAKLAKTGFENGWLANIEIEGPHYRRSRLREPCEALEWFSVSAVYLESDEEFSGRYHSHPYGEINMVIPIKGYKPELAGLDNFWCSSGWTCPGPGSHHYPSVRGGGILALFFLPAGRITYTVKPGDPQPKDVGLPNH